MKGTKTIKIHKNISSKPEMKIDREEFAPNRRLAEVITALDSSEKIVAKMLNISVSIVSGLISKERTTQITIKFLNQIKGAMPFLNDDFIDKGKGEMFHRKLTKDEIQKFKKTFGQSSNIKTSVHGDACDRVTAVRKRVKETQMNFSLKLDVVRAMVTAIEGRRQNPSLHFLIQLRRLYNVDIIWILTGEGEMFNSDNSNHDDAQDQIKLLDDEIAALKKEIERKNRVIDKLT